jgi:hypothetical protein
MVDKGWMATHDPLGDCRDLELSEIGTPQREVQLTTAICLQFLPTMKDIIFKLSIIICKIK